MTPSSNSTINSQQYPSVVLPTTTIYCPIAVSINNHFLKLHYKKKMVDVKLKGNAFFNAVHFGQYCRTWVNSALTGVMCMLN